jgi:uncharacterized membrane protein
LNPADESFLLSTMEESTLAGAEAPQTSAGRTFASLYATAVALAGLAAFVVFLANTSWYGVFKVIHVLAVILWLGGAAGLTLVAVRAERAKDKQQIISIAKQAEFLGMRIFTPASFVVLAMGIVLIHKSNGLFHYDQFWVLFGLIAWGFSAATGVLFFGPQTAKLNKLIAAKGPDDPEVEARILTILRVARADVVLILLIAADMVAKPFFT